MMKVSVGIMIRTFAGFQLAYVRQVVLYKRVYQISTAPNWVLFRPYFYLANGTVLCIQRPIVTFFVPLTHCPIQNTFTYGPRYNVLHTSGADVMGHTLKFLTVLRACKSFSVRTGKMYTLRYAKTGTTTSQLVNAQKSWCGKSNPSRSLTIYISSMCAVYLKRLLYTSTHLSRNKIWIVNIIWPQRWAHNAGCGSGLISRVIYKSD